MTLPVSSYEALLMQVRELTHETILLQRQLSSDLYQNVHFIDVNHNLTDYQKNYEQGKLVVDNVIRRCDRNIDIGQRSLVDRNEFVFHPGLTPSLECARESFNSGELTARLIAWRDQTCHRRPSHEEDKTSRRSKHWGTLRSDTTTGIPSAARVGVEVSDGGDGASSLVSWNPTGLVAEIDASRRPFYAAGDPALSAREHSRTTITAEVRSATKLVVPSVACTLVPTSSDSVERCKSTTRTSYLDHDHLHQSSRVNPRYMDPDGKDDNEPDSATPSPELYARTGKSYDDDGSSEDDGKPEDGSQSHRLASLYHGTWPVKRDLWTGQQMSYPGPQTGSAAARRNDMASVMSFSSSTGMSSCSSGMQGHRRLGAKVDVVYSLLGMLGSTEGREDMSSTLLAMSNSMDSCPVMRQSGCLPLLIQLIHAPGQDSETRERASRALHNVVHARSDEKIGRREARVLRLLEQVRDYCQSLRSSLETERPPDDLERHPGPTIAALMKLSFDEAHRHAMCQLGGLHAVAELIEMDHAAHGVDSDDQSCVTLRRYAGMALTNLTFGDGNNKALLCSFRAFMRALVSQLRSMSDDLRQVTASVLRNLSWRADSSSKQTLREVGAVTGLMKAAMEGRKESTLKSILSALWNLSAHCSTNKVDICAVEGALAFLVDMLSYKAPSKTLSIVENAGGILRNVSSHIAVREDYRSVVRERGCLQVLLRQLRSPSLTVVSNACGALWNLSARCPHDQRLLWDLGAVPMLRSLVHSKHKMISMGSSAALKNLLSARPAGSNLVHLDSTARGLGLSTLPSLVARRQRALEQEIDQNLAETCDNIEPSTSPTNKDEKFPFKLDENFVDVNSRGGAGRCYHLPQGPSVSKYNVNGGVARSDSRESMRSITSTHSDTIFERVNRHANNGLTPAELQLKQQSSSLHSTIGSNNPQTINDSSTIRTTNQTEKKYALRYKNSIPKRLRPTDLGVNEIDELRCTTSTMSWATVGPHDQESACSQIVMNSSIDDGPSCMNTSKLSGRSNVAETYYSKTNEITSRCANLQMNYKSPTTTIVDSNFGIVDTTESVRPIVVESDTTMTNNPAIHSPTLSHGSETDPFEVYAETDIDQPTNYSLRYAERNSDEDDKQSSGYFAGSEQETEDTIKTYYTEGTPYETPSNLSGAASDNDLPDVNGIRCPSKKIYLAGINRVSRDIRRESYGLKKTGGIVNSVVATKNDDLSPGSLFDADISVLLPNSLENDSDVTKSSESLADSGVAAAERSESSACDSETLKSSLDVDCASSIDAAVTRLNGLVLNDQPNIINDSRNKKRETIEQQRENVGIDAENFPETMISDGDEDDEDLLAACIHIGMQNNRHRQSFRRNSLEKTPPEESNLARYQTSTALDQVEDSKFPDQTDNHPLQPQSDTPRFNIKITSQPNTMENGYSSFEDNLNVVQDDDKITVEYKKLDGYTCCETSSTSSPDLIDGNVDPGKQEKMMKIARQTSRVNSVEDNHLAHQDFPGNNLEMGKPLFRVNSESTERCFDSVERSEQALLHMCIKIDSPKSTTIPTIETTSDFSLARQLTTDDYSLTENDDSSTSYDRRLISEQSNYDEVVIMDDDDDDTRTKETQAKTVEDEYRRQRDPDAMIASLDRLTATLVQQTEAMRERESTTSAMKQSVMSDTWNEDSPNDVSYPSISVSAPFIASFKSDVDDVEQTLAIPSMPILRECENHHCSSSSSLSSNLMTTSRIIEREAIRVAEVVSAEGTRQQFDQQNVDFSSLTSHDLESIKPPSTMNSLTSLTASCCHVGGYENLNDPTTTTTTTMLLTEERCHSTSISPVRHKNAIDEKRNLRKKSLPIGVMAKRALSHAALNNVVACNSLESLLNDCSLATSSQLENVKPPSMMDELLDNGDMENSMLSVASITSEIADSKDHDSNGSLSLTRSDPIFDSILKPVANVLSLSCQRYADTMETSANDNSITEYLENINPPSLLNEISEMDDSTVDANTDTLCDGDTLCIDVDLKTDDIQTRTLIVENENKHDNDTDEEEEEEDDNCGTMIFHTESCYTSSAESTPKKRFNKNNNLTPKQKRQLAKERYKTYTIAAELVKKEEEQRKKHDNDNDDDDDNVKNISRGKCSPFTKLTPKQRRQEDRARFQTQVLENPLANIDVAVRDQLEKTGIVEESLAATTTTTEKSSSIPTLANLCGGRTFRRKRIDANDKKDTNDRYRTTTLNDVETISPEISTTNRVNEDEMIHTMLEKNANIVIHTLNETSEAANVEETIIECETLSLVSNDSESEQSLRMRFANGLTKKLLTSYVEKANERKIESPFQQNDATKSTDQTIDRRGETVDTEFTLRMSDYESNSDGDDDDDDEARLADEEPAQQPKRPRITKPGGETGSGTVERRVVEANNHGKSEPGSPKGIRGRRKALYSTPNTRKPTPQSSPAKQQSYTGIPIVRSNTSPVVRATRATTLRQNTNTTTTTAATAALKDATRSNATMKNFRDANTSKIMANRTAALAKRSSIPQRGIVVGGASNAAIATTKTIKRHSTPPGCTIVAPSSSSSSSVASQRDAKTTENCAPKGLERQGTFTKDEPEVENAPTVVISSPGKSKIAKPTRGSPIRVNPTAMAGKSKIGVRTYQTSAQQQQQQQSKLTKCGSTEKIQSSRISPSPGTGKRSTIPESIIASTETSKMPRRMMSLGQRSNSNCSILSSTPTATTTTMMGRKLPKEATSKIASLWKKVEDSKNKRKYEKPDSRQWITATTDVTDVTDTDDLGAITCKPPVFRLFRSSTFEGVSQDAENGDDRGTEKLSQTSNGIFNGCATKYRNSCDLTGMTSADAPCKIPLKLANDRTNVTAAMPIGYNTIVLRKQRSCGDATATDTATAIADETDVTKRISRLGSFIRVDSAESEKNVESASTRLTNVVTTFDCNPRSVTTSSVTKTFLDEDNVRDCQTDIVTASATVTTV